MKYPDISIDIETLGNSYDAPIISIGAVCFDRDTGKLGPTFYQEVELDSAIKAGRVSGSTLSFWMQQSDDARMKLFGEDQSHKLPLSTALFAMRNLIEKECTNVRPWGNGSTFDITIIEHALHVGCVGQPAPWRYQQIRDVRTIVDAAEVVVGFDRSTVKRVGVHHNALDDAMYQANLVIAAFSALRRTDVVKSQPVVTESSGEDW